ncbi:MAG: ribonuclease HII [Candidatus Liptonbacteria bacterium]|nr:ribonuclease HII [Candidatus Liptonbacteria bacterium]
MRKKYTIGIDEVGRGCLAGPVVVCAALFTRGMKIHKKELGMLKDSKKLNPALRERWFRHLKELPVAYSLSRVQPKTIDRINISQAANLAALRACKRLILNAGLKSGTFCVYLDGGLYLGRHRGSFLKDPAHSMDLTSSPRASSGRIIARTIIRGDEKIKVISAASIFAKVSRDRFMKKLAKKYPKYGLELHKGYGTKLHIKALKKHGASKIHRKTFIGGFS